MSNGSADARALILGRPLAAGTPVPWDNIVLIDVPLWRAAEQYAADGPARAAQDF